MIAISAPARTQACAGQVHSLRERIPTARARRDMLPCPRCRTLGRGSQVRGLAWDGLDGGECYMFIFKECQGRFHNIWKD